MGTFFIKSAAIVVFSLTLIPLRGETGSESNASARAVKIATDNGLDSEQAKDLGDKLRGIFQSNSKDDTRVAEVVKLCRADPKQAAAIAAAATAFVPGGDFAPEMAGAAAKAVRSQAPAIAGSVAAENPHDAARIAARVARAVPSATSRITRRVAYAVPWCIEGIGLKKRTSRGLESAIIMAVPAASPLTIMNAAQRGANQAARDGRPMQPD